MRPRIYCGVLPFLNVSSCLFEREAFCGWKLNCTPVAAADMDETNTEMNESGAEQSTPKYTACLITMLCMLCLIDASVIIYSVCFWIMLMACTVSVAV